MKVNVVETQTGSSFLVEANGSGPVVLRIKQNIQNLTGVPVARQTLFLKGKLLRDDESPLLYENCRLRLSISHGLFPVPVPSDTIGTTIHGEGQAFTAEQSSKIEHDLRHVARKLAPVTKVNIDIRSGSSFVVDVDGGSGPVVRRIKQKIEMIISVPVAQQILFLEGKVLQDDDESQVLSENCRLLLSFSDHEDKPNQSKDQAPVPLDTIGTTIHGEGQALTAEQSSKIEHDLRHVARKFAPPTKVTSFEEFYPSGKVGSTRKRTEQSSPLDSVINIPDSPVKKRTKTSSLRLTVIMKPFEVVVNGDDKVEELKKELLKMQARGEFLLQEGFELRNGQEKLTENQSFDWNLVANGAIIEICPNAKQDDQGPVATEKSRVTKTVHSFVDLFATSTKITVMVEPFKEARQIPVVVKADDNVEELRKELNKMHKKGELNLPQEGFELRDGQEITLTETRSFTWNLVSDGNAIGIFPSGYGRNINRA